MSSAANEDALALMLRAMSSTKAVARPTAERQNALEHMLQAMSSSSKPGASMLVEKQAMAGPGCAAMTPRPARPATICRHSPPAAERAWAPQEARRPGLPHAAAAVKGRHDSATRSADSPSLGYSGEEWAASALALRAWDVSGVAALASASQPIPPCGPGQEVTLDHLDPTPRVGSALLRGCHISPAMVGVDLQPPPVWQTLPGRTGRPFGQDWDPPLFELHCKPARDSGNVEACALLVSENELYLDVSVATAGREAADVHVARDSKSAAARALRFSELPCTVPPAAIPSTQSPRRPEHMLTTAEQQVTSLLQPLGDHDKMSHAARHTADTESARVKCPYSAAGTHMSDDHHHNRDKPDRLDRGSRPCQSPPQDTEDAGAAPHMSNAASKRANAPATSTMYTRAHEHEESASHVSSISPPITNPLTREQEPRGHTLNASKSKLLHKSKLPHKSCSPGPQPLSYAPRAWPMPNAVVTWPNSEAPELAAGTSAGLHAAVRRPPVGMNLNSLALLKSPEYDDDDDALAGSSDLRVRASSLRPADAHGASDRDVRAFKPDLKPDKVFVRGRGSVTPYSRSLRVARSPTRKHWQTHTHARNTRIPSTYTRSPTHTPSLSLFSLSLPLSLTDTLTDTQTHTHIMDATRIWIISYSMSQYCT